MKKISKNKKEVFKKQIKKTNKKIIQIKSANINNG